MHYIVTARHTMQSMLPTLLGILLEHCIMGMLLNCPVIFFQ